jgi:glycerophosphoryl diester phosphodiesterase
MHHSTDLSIVPPIIAHRGANAYAPENTLAAFLKAKELGLAWVEFDVMLSSDNELVVIHDEDLARTTNGQGAVIDYPYAFLNTLDAGTWFDPQFSTERILNLQTVLTFLYEHQLSANIELKALQHRDEVLVKNVVEILDHYEGRFTSTPLISSFSRPVLALVRNKSPDTLLGFLMDEWQSDWEKYCDQLQCVAVNVNYTILTYARAQAVKSTGRKLFAYTVNDDACATLLYSWGVDAIFSDCPSNIVNMKVYTRSA